MTSLVLRLAGPLQAWGSSSRFVRRTTEPYPTKSGIIGLLAAALGRRRTDPLEDLLGLRFGVRVDQPGEIVRDFQTAHSLDGQVAFPLSYRFYLADAVFLAVVEGHDSFVRGLAEALARPAFPLYLGRRSCPPSGPLRTEVVTEGVWEVLSSYPWQASPQVQRRNTSPVVVRDVALDKEAAPEHVLRGADQVVMRDAPVSFDPELREYGWREVVRTAVQLQVRDGDDGVGHDAMAIIGG